MTYRTAERIARARDLAQQVAGMDAGIDVSVAGWWLRETKRCLRPRSEQERRWRVREAAREHQAKQDWRRQEHRRIHRAIPLPVRRDLLELPCSYCSSTSDVVDHIVPVSRGGTRKPHNLAPACWDCNAEKLDFTVSEWAARRVSQGLSWPPTRSPVLASVS